MKTRNWLAVASGALALGTFSIVGNAYMAPHAHAQPLAQARPVTSTAGLNSAVTTFYLCLALQTGECITGHGGGNQVTIDTSNTNNFHVVRIESGTNWEQLENGAGRCLREYADNSVVLAFGGCSSTNDAEWWFDSNPDQCCARTTFENLKYTNNYMGTFGTNSGRGVWAEPQQSGFDVGWIEQ